MVESRQQVVLLCQPQAGTIDQQGFRFLRELHALVPLPSQLAPPAFVTNAWPAVAATRRCCSLTLAAGGSWLRQTTLKPAASFLHARQSNPSWEAKVTAIFCSAVTHCQPECGAMVELLRELNGDGNFGQFIRAMRKAWQQQCA